MLKLLFKPIKWLLGIIIVTLLPFIIVGALLYKSVTPPEIENTSLDLKTYLQEQVDLLIDPVNTDKTLDILINEDIINVEIRNAILEKFESIPTDDYLYEDENFMFQGAWVEFKEDTINIFAGVHLNARIFTYKTAVQIRFKILSETDGVLTLKLDKFKVGSLSLKWAIKSAPKLISRFLGQDLDGFIDNALSGLATYDASKMELSVDLYSLVDKLQENKEVATLLLDLIYENDLVDIGILEDDEVYKIGVRVNMNKLEDRTPALIVDDEDKFETEEDLQDFLYNKALASIVSTNNSIKITQYEMNIILDYIFKQSTGVTNDFLIRQAVFESYEIIVGIPYITITEDLFINLPIKFGRGTDFFETTFKLNAELSIDNKDLLITFNGIVINELNIESEHLDLILSLVENDTITGRTMRIEGFLESLEETGIEITNITTENGALLFHYEGFSGTEILEDIKDIINNPVLEEKVDELLDKVANDEEITEEDVLELIEIFDTLTEDEIQDILDLISGYLP